MSGELPHPVPLSQLADAVVRRPLPGGVGSVEFKRSYDPDESWVAATFNRHGEIDAVDFGRDACLIVERSTISESGPYPQLLP